jgi:hypothetical protein
MKYAKQILDTLTEVNLYRIVLLKATQALCSLVESNAYNHLRPQYHLTIALIKHSPPCLETYNRMDVIY